MFRLYTVSSCVICCSGLTAHFWVCCFNSLIYPLVLGAGDYVKTKRALIRAVEKQVRSFCATRWRPSR